MKAKRHAKILEIIRKYDVDTQEELCVRLNEAGYKVTQATVSRDIREFKINKSRHQRWKTEIHIAV